MKIRPFFLAGFLALFGYVGMFAVLPALGVAPGANVAFAEDDDHGHDHDDDHSDDHGHDHDDDHSDDHGHDHDDDHGDDHGSGPTAPTTGSGGLAASGSGSNGPLLMTGIALLIASLAFGGATLAVNRRRQR